ncbi:hypothetical protein D3C86_1733780 [compost metagenome]
MVPPLALVKVESPRTLTPYAVALPSVLRGLFTTLMMLLLSAVVLPSACIPSASPLPLSASATFSLPLLVTVLRPVAKIPTEPWLLRSTLLTSI